MTIHGSSRGRGHVWLVLLAVLGAALVSVLALTQWDSPARADQREGSAKQITLERSAADPAFQRELTEASNGGVYEPSIVGGTPVPDGKYPFMAFLQIRFSDGNSGNCGGTLIDPDSVLTAAHCILTPTTAASGYSVGVGGTAKSQPQFHVRSVTKALYHPKYNRGDLSNGYDAAVLKLNSAIPQSIKPIKLNTPTGGVLETPGRMLTVAGWGRTSVGGPKPDRMNEVSLPVVSDATAQQAWSNEYVPSLMVATDSQTGKDAYVGDSGGPLFNPGATPTQVGIVSFGGFGTTFAGRPTGYTDINNSEITAFIENAAKQ